MKRLITSEQVTEGHPDKIADQISDAVLAEALLFDTHSRVAIETMVTPGLIHIGGELSTETYIDFSLVARNVLHRIGQSHSLGLPADTVAILPTVIEQSPEIGEAVSEARDDIDSFGAGDQGMMFGYATTETSELMPMPIALANKIAFELSQARKEGMIKHLRPDGKVQVTIEYQGSRPVKADTILVSTQHGEGFGEMEKQQVLNLVIKPALKSFNLPSDFTFVFNPSGSFVTGGVMADSGLTGRKIIADTYGGVGRHGGGAFSGKDSTKVDRSGAYAMRWVAKNLVASGLCEKAEVQIAYAIGLAEPVGFYVDTFDTGKISDERLAEAVLRSVDLRPEAIVRQLGLRTYDPTKTTCYGHFGKPLVSWEQLDLAQKIESEI